MMKKTTLKNYIKLTILLSAFFVSCKQKNEQIGINIQGKEGFIAHNILDSEIDFSLAGILKSDSLLTSGSDLIHVGHYSDTYLGNVKSTSFFQVSLAGDLPDFGANPVCDSIHLHLGFNANTIENRILQGNPSIDNTLSVHLMIDPFAEGKNYFNSQTFAFDPNPIATINYNPLQANGFLDIVLPASFGDQLIVHANKKSKTEFLQNFKGFALLGSASDGSIVAFNLNSTESYLKTNFTNEIAAQEYYFDLSTSNRHHINIESDRSGSQFAALNQTNSIDKSQTAQKLLIQNGTGASVVADFGDLLSLIDTTQNILVNKAVLFLPLNAATFDTQKNYPVSALKVYESDKNGVYTLKDGVKQQVVPDFNIVFNDGNGLFGLNTAKDGYEMDITYYIQDCIKGKRPLNSLLITPNVVLNNANFQARSNRSVLDASKASFKIYYSKI